MLPKFESIFTLVLFMVWHMTKISWKMNLLFFQNYLITYHTLIVSGENIGINLYEYVITLKNTISFVKHSMFSIIIEGEKGTTVLKSRSLSIYEEVIMSYFYWRHVMGFISKNLCNGPLGKLKLSKHSHVGIDGELSWEMVF